VNRIVIKQRNTIAISYWSRLAVTNAAFGAMNLKDPSISRTQFTYSDYRIVLHYPPLRIHSIMLSFFGEMTELFPRGEFSVVVFFTVFFSAVTLTTRTQMQCRVNNRM
jgi:hypothetical protein